MIPPIHLPRGEEVQPADPPAAPRVPWSPFAISAVLAFLLLAALLGLGSCVAQAHGC